MFGKMENGKTYYYRLDKTWECRSAPVALSVEQQDEGGTKYHNVASATATDGNWSCFQENLRWM